MSRIAFRSILAALAAAALLQVPQAAAQQTTNPIPREVQFAVDKAAFLAFIAIVKAHAERGDIHSGLITDFVVNGLKFGIKGGNATSTDLLGTSVDVVAAAVKAGIADGAKRRDILLAAVAGIETLFVENDPTRTRLQQRQLLAYLASIGVLDDLRENNTEYVNFIYELKKFDLLKDAQDVAYNAAACIQSADPNYRAVCAWTVDNVTPQFSQLRLILGKKIVLARELKKCGEAPGWYTTGADRTYYRRCAERAEAAANTQPYELTTDAYKVPPGVRNFASPSMGPAGQPVWQISELRLSELKDAFDKVYPEIASNGYIPAGSYTPEERIKAEIYRLVYRTNDPDARVAALGDLSNAFAEMFRQRSMPDALFGFLQYMGMALSSPDVRATIAIKALREATDDAGRAAALKAWAAAVVARDQLTPAIPIDPSALVGTIESRVSETVALLADGSVQRTRFDGASGLTEITTITPDNKSSVSRYLPNGYYESELRDARGKVTQKKAGTRDGRLENSYDGAGNLITHRVADGITATIYDRSGGVIEKQVSQADGSIKTFNGAGILLGVLKPAAYLDGNDKSAWHYRYEDYINRSTTYGNGTTTLIRNWDNGSITTIAYGLRCDDQGCRRNDSLSEALFQMWTPTNELACKLLNTCEELINIPGHMGRINPKVYNYFFDATSDWIDDCEQCGIYGCARACDFPYKAPYLEEDPETGWLVHVPGWDGTSFNLELYARPWSKTSYYFGNSANKGPASSTGMMRVRLLMKGGRPYINVNVPGHGWMQVPDPNAAPATEDFTFLRAEGEAGAFNVDARDLVGRYRHILEAVHYGNNADGSESSYFEVVNAVGYGYDLPRGGLASAIGALNAATAKEGAPEGCTTALEDMRIELVGKGGTRRDLCVVQSGEWQADFMVPADVATGQYALELIRTTDGRRVAVKLVNVVDPYPSIGRGFFDREAPAGWLVRTGDGDPRYEQLDRRVDVSKGEVWVSFAAAGVRGMGRATLRVNGATVAPDYAGPMPATRIDQVNLRLRPEWSGRQSIELCTERAGGALACSEPVVLELVR